MEGVGNAGADFRPKFCVGDVDTAGSEPLDDCAEAEVEDGGEEEDKKEDRAAGDLGERKRRAGAGEPRGRGDGEEVVWCHEDVFGDGNCVEFPVACDNKLHAVVALALDDE